MPTPSYLVAQQVIPRVKAKCPRIMQIAQGKNSFTFSVALREEGDAMQHYDGDCHRGQSHIFSVRNAKGFRTSTLELRPKRSCRRQPCGRQPGTHKGGWQYAIAQHRGVQNAAVSATCKTAAERFLKQVNDFLKVATCKPQKECA